MKAMLAIQFCLYLQVEEFYRNQIKNRDDIVALRSNIFNEKLVSIGLTPIKNLQKSVQTYKLGMYYLEDFYPIYSRYQGKRTTQCWAD